MTRRLNGTPVNLHDLEPEEFPRCRGTIHVWSSIFTFGDACACGRFSLCQGEDGRLRTVDAMPLDDEAAQR